MDTRLSTKFRAGGSRMRYQPFDYSTSGTDYKLSETTLPFPTYPQDLEQPEVHTEPNPEPEAQDLVSGTSCQDCLPQLFSDHERTRSPSPQLSPPDYPPPQSLVGTSALL